MKSILHTSPNAVERRSILLRTVSLVLVCGLVASCAKEESTNAFVDPTVPADQLYNEALANIDVGDVPQARRKFKKLDRQHPYSGFAKKSS
ncbi:MAG: hypothetical protein AAFO68_03975, partial [Pseudomonadota bacterium]